MQQDVAFLEQQCTIKTKGENVMFVNPELHGKRQEQLDENVRKATREHEEAKKNSRFTQVSPKGWERVRELLTDKQGVAALRLYSFLAEHIDPSCGAVVADQQFLADKMGVIDRQ